MKLLARATNRVTPPITIQDLIIIVIMRSPVAKPYGAIVSAWIVRRNQPLVLIFNYFVSAFR